MPLDLGWRAAPFGAAPCAFRSYPTACLYVDSAAEDTHSWRVPGAASAADCAAAACAAREAAWTWWGGARSECFVGEASIVSINTSACAGATSGVADWRAWPPALPAEAARAFDDAAWAVVDLPHDAAADLAHELLASGGQGYRRPTAVVYRKHFRLDASWANSSALTLSLPGALAASALWLNGVALLPRSDAGYLPRAARIDAAQFSLTFGAAGPDNVLAVWTDNSLRKGWWEEGCGIVRGGATLVVAAAAGAIAPSGVAAPAFIDGAIHARAAPADGLWADAARLSPSADVELAAAGAVSILWTLIDPRNGAPVGVANATAHLPAGGGTVAAAPGSLLVAAAELWSVARPFLYSLRTELSIGGGGGDDAREDAVGVRDVAWSGDQGMMLNEQRVKMRGFCEHATWGGVGAAVPARADLLRLQQLRGVGGNALRTSHNPPAPQLLDLADRLGVVVLDENRVLAHLDNVRGGAECGAGGCVYLPAYAGDVVADAGALARRDRLHASVVFYSICNEMGCGPGTLLENNTIVSVKEAIVAADPSRAVSSNNGWQGPNATRPGTPMYDVLDVAGMSHQSAATLEAFHAASPAKPVSMNEWCSCESMRGADADLPHNASEVFYSSEASACLAEQTQVSNAPEFCAGTFVWISHDYGGEPDRWPHVSSGASAPSTLPASPSPPRRGSGRGGSVPSMRRTPRGPRCRPVPSSPRSSRPGDVA